MGSAACSANCSVDHSSFQKLPEDSETAPTLAKQPSLGDVVGKAISDRYAFNGLIGLGSASRIYLAYDKKMDYDVVAVKISPKSDATCAAALFNREVAALTKLKHPFIVDMLDHMKDDENFVIVTEYCVGGTAWEYTKRKDFREGDLCYLAMKMVDAIEYIHSENVVHRDIHPRNILFSDEECEQCVLSGFNMAMVVEDETYYRNRAGTISFMPPEMAPSENVVQRSGATMKSADVFAFGATLYFLLTKSLPFGDQSMPNTEIWRHVKKCDTKDLKFPPNTTQPCQDFILKCLAKNPEDRPTMKEARMHRWLSGSCDEEEW